MDFIADAIVEKKEFLSKGLLESIRNKLDESSMNSFSLFQNLSGYFSTFIDDLWIYIEYPYVDKLYRSSYYMYYSSKHKSYNRNCFRLSFFNHQIIDNDFFYEEGRIRLQEAFLGFMVLRPTAPQFIGRNILSPLVFKNRDFECCLTKDEVTIRGVKLTVHGFPHESQDGEFSTCAETSIWSLVEYFSHKYPEYKTILLSDITKTLNDDAIERVTPSQGLSPIQISWILKKFGFDPKTYFATEMNHGNNIDDTLKKVLFTYIDSGIPVICGLRLLGRDSIGHAIVVIGRSVLDFEKVKEKVASLPVKYYNLYDLMEECSIVTIDDNMPPYNIVSFANPTMNYSTKLPSMITSIVAPLYPKMNLEASQAMQVTDYFLNNTFQSLLSDVFHEDSLKQSAIYKLLLSSSRSFKSFVAKLENLDNNLKSLIVSISMPKFVWIVEVSNLDLMEKDKINGFIIIDATASNIQVMCIILNGKLTLNYGKEWTDCSGCDILPAYKNNLKGMWNQWKM